MKRIGFKSLIMIPRPVNYKYNNYNMCNVYVHGTDYNYDLILNKLFNNQK